MATISQPENAIVKLDDYAGALATVNDKIQTAGLEVTYDTDDAISLSDDHENHTLGRKDAGNFDMDAVYTRAWGVLAIGRWRCPTTKTFSVEFGPSGSTVGYEKHAFETLMTGFEMSVSDTSTTSLSTKNKVTGAINKTTW